MYRLKQLSLAVMFIAALGLAGCGGGGGGSTATEEPPPMPSAEDVACGGGPSEACVMYHMENVANVTGNPNSTLGEVQAAQAALATAQSELSAKQMADAAAAMEAEIAACGAAGGRWEAEAGTCTSAEDLAAEQEAADLAEALKPFQEQTAAALVTVRAHAAAAAAAFAPIAGADPEDENYIAAKYALDTANRRVRQVEIENERALNADSIAAAAAAARVTEIRVSQAEFQVGRIHAAVEAYNADMAKAATALGKLMYAALGSNPLGHLNPTGTGTIVGDTLNLDDDTGVDIPGMKAGNSVGSLGGWNGTGYSQSEGEGSTLEANDAVVYTNQGPGKFEPFSESEHTIATDTTTDDIKGYYTVDETNDLAHIMSDAFLHSGTQTHQKPERSDALYIRGKFDGADGEYRCTGACSSTNDGKGSPSALSGVWHFKPDAGAMVHEPDENYLYFGWWVKNGASGPVEASAFVGVVGDVDGAGTATTSGTALTGSATYNGHAVGKFAITNTLEGTGDAGHFTADAELEATFGSGNAAGMTGTIDNFRLNDGSEDPNWVVSLHRAGWGSNGAILAPTNDANTPNVDEALGTTWSINGNVAPASGTWSGQMYDEKPGDSPSGDGSNVPTTVTGTFQSTFTESGIGRMVGAFGANRQE